MCGSSKVVSWQGVNVSVIDSPCVWDDDERTCKTKPDVDDKKGGLSKQTLIIIIAASAGVIIIIVLILITLIVYHRMTKKLPPIPPLDTPMGHEATPLKKTHRSKHYHSSHHNHKLHKHKKKHKRIRQHSSRGMHFNCLYYSFIFCRTFYS
jgi:hypothetical protein